MRRHAWKNTGTKPEPTNLDSADPASPIEHCNHCGTDRARDRGTKSLYVYRGGKATVGDHRKPIPEGKWAGYTVIPLCVER